MQVCGAFVREWRKHGNRKGKRGMKTAIIEMINKADDRQIERLFFFIRAFLS